MKLHDMLHLEVFSTCKVLTGEIGITNDVESVMVLEATDIEIWGRKDQIILTSYYALSDLNKSELRDFLGKMSSIGSSALVVKMERLIKMIPEELIELCIEFEIPLIKIEKDIAYEKIVLAIYRPILNYQSYVLETYYEVRQSFTKIEKNLPSFERIMDTFYELIKRDCQLLIPEKKVHVQRLSTQEPWVILSAVPMESKKFTKNQYELVTLFSREGAQQSQALKTTIYHSHFQEVTLYVYESGRAFDDVDLMIIENLLDVVVEKLQMEYLLKRDRYNRLNSLTNALLEGSTFSIEERDDLLNEAGLAVHDYYQGVAISFKDDKVMEKRRILLNKLKMFGREMIYHDNPNNLIALFNLPDREMMITADKLKEQFAALFQEENLAWNIVVSRIKKRETIHEILPECLDTMKFNANFFISHCLSVDDLGIFRYFIHHDKLDELKELIPEKILALYQDAPALFETLASYLKNDKNYNKTAEELFLHPKTVRYRINKINKALNVDFEQPLNSLNYQISIYLLEWEKKRRS